MGCVGCSKPEECKRNVCCGHCPDNDNCPFEAPCPVCKPKTTNENEDE